MRSQTSFPHRSSSFTKLQLFACALAVFCGAAVGLHATTITVTITNDSGPGSLRDALANAVDGDTIHCAVTGTILLTSGELSVVKSIDIIGPGPALLSMNGNNANRVFYIGPSNTVSISSLTITNGAVHDVSPNNVGGGIWNDHSTLTVSNCTLSGNSAGDGAGIFNDHATLAVNNCMFKSNSASQRGGSIFNAGGGCFANECIYGKATLTVSNCTFNGDSASNSGGSIFNDGNGNGEAHLEIVNTTMSDDSTSLSGGGIFNGGAEGSATVWIANSTLSGNSAYQGGGIFNSAWSEGNGGSTMLTIINSTLSGNSAFVGGGILSIVDETGSAALQIGSTILNAGTSGANIVGGTVTSLGNNLSNEDSGLTATGDRINPDPMLGPLQDNGGPTFTHALLCGSPAIDEGRNFSGSATDQRSGGFARTFDDPAVPNVTGSDGTDVGAFEAQQPLPSLCNSPPVAKCKNLTVSAGLDCMANASIDDGSFDPDAGDTITLSQSPAGPYALGVTTVTLTVSDSHGASNSCSATVTVVDTTPPVITCPSNIVVNAVSSKGAFVSFTPIASDDCSTASVSSTPPSGSRFAIGDTIVSSIATDDAGNQATCSFTVHVKGAAEQIDDLIALVQRLHLKPWTANSLIASLRAASSALHRGNTHVACGNLDVFIFEVDVQTWWRQIWPAPRGRLLIRRAQRIRAVLDCHDGFNPGHP